ncbi:unnamed protein product, partial [Meganyctiphanes norvegica]
MLPWPVSAGGFTVSTVFIMTVGFLVPGVSCKGVLRHKTMEDVLFHYNGLHHRNHIFKKMPRVDVHHSGNVTAQLGHTALLRCRVHNKGNYTVNWSLSIICHVSNVQYDYPDSSRYK